MTETILVINAASSSIKFQLFASPLAIRLDRRLKGQFEGIGCTSAVVRWIRGRALIDAVLDRGGRRALSSGTDKRYCFPSRTIGRGSCAIGHRVVHGGPDVSAEPVIDQ